MPSLAGCAGWRLGTSWLVHYSRAGLAVAAAAAAAAADNDEMYACEASLIPGGQCKPALLAADDTTI